MQLFAIGQRLLLRGFLLATSPDQSQRRPRDASGVVEGAQMTRRTFTPEEIERGRTTPPLASVDRRTEPTTLVELLVQWDEQAQRLDDMAAGKRGHWPIKERHDISIRAASIRNCAGQLRVLLSKG